MRTLYVVLLTFIASYLLGSGLMTVGKVQEVCEPVSLWTVLALVAMLLWTAFLGYRIAKEER